jgi:mono/diheme cytochrome c family protein
MAVTHPKCKKEHMRIYLSQGMAASQAATLIFQTVSAALCVALCDCSMTLSGAKTGPDPLVASGQQTARIVCSQCHVVGPDQEFSPEIDVSAPAFEDIARRHTTSEQSLERFISKTHWDGQTIPITMPAPGLTRQEIISVARYIMSLRKS